MSTYPAGPVQVTGDLRPTLVVFGDPATHENYILSQPLLDRATLDVVAVRANKSSALIGHIIASIDSVATYGATAHDDDMLITLLREPELTDQDLHAMTHLAGGQFLRAGLQSAICLHPLASQRTIIDSLWRSPAHVAELVAAATRTLLPAAVSWVSRQLDCAGREQEHTFAVSALQHSQIAQTLAAWTVWTGDDPARVAALTATSFAFTDEQTLFAVAQALLTAPARI